MITELILFVIAAALIFINERRVKLGLDNMIMGVMVVLLIPLYFLFYLVFGFLLNSIVGVDAMATYDPAVKAFSMCLALVVNISLITFLVNRKKAQIKKKKDPESPQV